MKVSDWISVNDRLPRTTDYVFVCRECGGERFLEFPDDCMKHVVEGCDKEPYHAIADDIQGAMSGMVVSNKYQIEIKITAL